MTGDEKRAEAAWEKYVAETEWASLHLAVMPDIRLAYIGGWQDGRRSDAEPQDVGTIVVLTYADERPKAVGLRSISYGRAGGWLLVTARDLPGEALSWRDLLDGVESWEVVS